MCQKYQLTPRVPHLLVVVVGGAVSRHLPWALEPWAAKGHSSTPFGPLHLLQHPDIQLPASARPDLARSLPQPQPPHLCQTPSL